MALIRVRFIAGIAAATVVLSGVVASPANAIDASEAASLSLPETLVLEHAEKASDLALPGGGALRLPPDATVVSSRGGLSIDYAEGLHVEIPAMSTRTPGGFYPAVVTTYSRSQTETVYKAIGNIENICRFVPLPYLAGIGCSASPTVKNAFNQAHYQKKRVQQLFYRSKTCSSCSRTDYRVIK